METKFESFKRGFIQGLGIILVICIALIIVILIFIYCTDPINSIYNKFVYTSNQIPINPSDQNKINLLYSKNLIISAHEIFDNILSYYNTLITFLIALLGVGTIIAYFNIRSISKEKAEQQAAKAVKDYFETQKAHDILKSAAVGEINEWRDELEELQEKVSFIEENVELNNIELDDTIKGKENGSD